MADKRKIRIEAFTVKIEKEKLKYKQINEKRRNRAIAKNKTTYKPKVLKDTLFTRISFGERIKYKYGQPPVIMDTLLVRKTQEQMRLFLRKKGFYYASISVDIEKNEKKRFAIPAYTIKTGLPYVIDSLKYAGSGSVKGAHIAFLKKQKDLNGEESLKGKYLDVEMLDEHRYLFSRYMKDKGYHKFFATNTLYELDTNANTMKVNVKLIFNLDAKVSDQKKRDSLNRLPLKSAQIRNVIFHLSDSIMVRGDFSSELNGLNTKDSLAPQFLSTTKQTYYNRIKASKSRLKSFPELKPGDPDPYMEIMLKYNGVSPWVKPELLSLQNYLEHRNGYKEKYLERSYRSLQQLGVFDNIKPILIDVGENKSFSFVDVHYFLEPSKKHSFG
ncbi:MAG: hypothetical protein ACKN86_09525, partial [Crocinitomicaceae bacterium]